MIFNRFLVRLGVVLAPFLAPKLAQNRLKIASRRFLRPYFFKNADFHADLRFPRFFHQNRPQDEAKIGLRSPQDGPKTILFRIFLASFFASIFCRFLDRFWSHFGTLLGAKLAPKSDTKSTKNRPAPPDRPKTAPRAPQERPKSAKTNVFDDFCNMCLILFFDFYVLLLYLTSTTVARIWVDFWTDVERYCCRLLVFVLIPD